MFARVCVSSYIGETKWEQAPLGLVRCPLVEGEGFSRCFVVDERLQSQTSLETGTYLLGKVIVHTTPESETTHSSP